MRSFFLSPQRRRRAQCIACFDGLDVTKQIIDAAVAEKFPRRGVSLLIVDRAGVDANHIGMIALSRLLRAALRPSRSASSAP